jgi:hypothetical protein
MEQRVDGECWYTDMLGCSIKRFSMGDVSMWIGPSSVKQGGGVRNHDSSNEREGRDDDDDDLVKES